MYQRAVVRNRRLSQGRTVGSTSCKQGRTKWRRRYPARSNQQKLGKLSLQELNYTAINTLNKIVGLFYVQDLLNHE